MQDCEEPCDSRGSSRLSERLELRLLRLTRLDEQAKRKNMTKSCVRAKVEHPFRTLKRNFCFDKARYRGIKKSQNRLCACLAWVNLS